MKFISVIFLLSLLLAKGAYAEPKEVGTIRAIELARKDFQARATKMYPANGEYSVLRDLDSYAMGVAATTDKVIIVFFVDKRLGIIGGGGQYTLSKKTGGVINFRGYE